LKKFDMSRITAAHGLINRIRQLAPMGGSSGLREFASKRHLGRFIRFCRVLVMVVTNTTHRLTNLLRL